MAIDLMLLFAVDESVLFHHNGTLNGLGFSLMVSFNHGERQGRLGVKHGKGGLYAKGGVVNVPCGAGT